MCYAIRFFGIYTLLFGYAGRRIETLKLSFEVFGAKDSFELDLPYEFTHAHGKNAEITQITKRGG